MTILDVTTSAQHHMVGILKWWAGTLVGTLLLHKKIDNRLKKKAWTAMKEKATQCEVGS